MKNIFIKDPETAVNYLKPDNLKQLLITVGIKLALAVAGMLAMPIGDYSGFSKFILLLLLFAFVYDVCCLYQFSLHVTQSILIGFLLFLVLLLGVAFLFEYGLAFLAGLNPATATGENVLLTIMTVIFLIPFVIDIVRLIKLGLSRLCRGRQG